MADEGMDPCECIWNHEMAMRRLLSLLRQSQTTCSDTECYTEVPTAGDNGFMMMTLCWMAFAFVLYLMRPSTIRNSEDNSKPRNDGQGSDGSPPAPPNAF